MHAPFGVCCGSFPLNRKLSCEKIRGDPKAASMEKTFRYDATYFPASSTRAATCSCKAITFTGSDLVKRRSMVM